MKLQFKHQKFQADAAKAVVDVFAGQPCLTPTYRMDQGSGYDQHTMTEEEDFIGWSNQKLVPELTDAVLLTHIQRIQQRNQITPSSELAGRYNLTIEMETGVGKTYTYCKTMYELNKHYGWSKFIIVVPSVAIREGVYQSLQITQEHFGEEYGKKISFFIYNSSCLAQIDRFVSDSSLHVMIINAQAFNARGEEARRIYRKLDTFRSRRPIDMIAGTNPILIIDEPQSVEGRQTRERLKEFRPLFTLRYSATHKADSMYNIVYRLDALEAYHKKLVKKIAVKGISEAGSAAVDSYVYLQGINLSGSAPTATLQFDCQTKSGIIKKVTRIAGERYNLYDHSGGLEEYREGFVITRIDGRHDSVEFLNGLRIYAGDILGRVSQMQMRRLQIRETILSHLERERMLFQKGIKVLSLFFIDEVDHYRKYDAAGQAHNGIFADMFEEEYQDIMAAMQKGMDVSYENYLARIPVASTHAGYFSVDRKGRMINSKLADKKEKVSDDMEAYDLIMKNKELLLDIDPERSPVRFLFSHSALREGWDNPNVFQICTLKQSSSEMRRRQEVGRGLRLCVNQNGERMDAAVLGDAVHHVNLLTIIASESYESFARGLQSEMAEAVADRPCAVREAFFCGKVIRDNAGRERVIGPDMARAIHVGLIRSGYLDQTYALTKRYYEAKANHNIHIATEAAGCEQAVIALLDCVGAPGDIQPENARSCNVELRVDRDKLAMPAFKALWEKIRSQSVYRVRFDPDELVCRAINALDHRLRVSGVSFMVESGVMHDMASRETLAAGVSFERHSTASYDAAKQTNAGYGVKYDLVGKLVEETALTRKAVVRILKGIRPSVFAQFQDNPQEFVTKAARLMNEEKAAVIMQQITYEAVDAQYGTDLFTESVSKGKLGVNVMKVKKHLYDHLRYDSETEKKFAELLDTDENVAVYVKLPAGFYISTPVGHYTPDWAIAFQEGTGKQSYFVAETKGAMAPLQLRGIEAVKIHCAREHFKAISQGEVSYGVTDSYQSLLALLRGKSI